MKTWITLSVIFIVICMYAAKASAVISEQDAIQYVRTFIGDNTAQVTSSLYHVGLTTPEPTGSSYDFWANQTSCYWLHSGARDYRVNASTGEIECVRVTSDLLLYPSEAINVEDMWSRFPTMPRNQMQQRYANIIDANCWMLRNQDNTWVYNTQIVFWKNEQGLVKMVSILHHTMPYPLPTPTMTEQQAKLIAQAVAGSYAWVDPDNNIYSMPYVDVISVDGIDWRLNQQQIPEAVYEVKYIISSDPTVSASWLDPTSNHGVDGCGVYDVFVNAMTGAIIYSEPDIFLSMKADAVSAEKTKAVAKSENVVPKHVGRIVPLLTLKSLAKGHTLTAKAGEKAFTMDGKRIALPAKVVAKASTLYLPWQALKSLPGVKCSYDAKLNKLDITTSPAVKKAK